MNISMKLTDTIDMMQSGDYKERFRAEYYQIAIRYKKLIKMLEKWDNDELDFEPTCSRNTYVRQAKSMLEYMGILAERAIVENIKLDDLVM